MDIQFKVHRVSKHPVEVEGSYQGETAMMVVNELEVELTTAAEQHGSLTLRFRTSADIAEAVSKFTVGSTVTWTV